MRRFVREFPVTSTYTALIVTLIFILVLGQVLGWWETK